jgi:hypothetical protein
MGEGHDTPRQQGDIYPTFRQQGTVGAKKRWSLLRV